MRLKTFYANTMSEAMQMIRDSLGDDAIIVATGDRPAEGGVKVTAAVEPAFEIGQDGIAGSDSWLQYDEEQNMDAVTEEMTEILLRHCVPEDVMDHILSCVTVMGFDDISTALIYSLEHLYDFSPLPTGIYKRPIMMVGPPGSGKTLAVAKIAAKGAMSGLKVSVITTDTLRAGGVEQLQAFTKILKIDLKKAGKPSELNAMIDDIIRNSDQIIIDTPGLNPFDTDEVRILAKLMSAVDVRPIMVLPAGIDADEAGEMARVFATIGAREIMPTRTDIARRLGNLLSAAHQGGLSFSDYSNTSRVAQGLSPLTPKSLAQLLVPRLYKSEKADILQSSSMKREHQKTGTTQ